jgi:hypothetical protein
LANPAGDALEPEQIRAALKDAVESVRSAWAYCPKCREKVKADFPDHTARINALKLALEHGYGKPGQAKQEERLDLDIDVQTLTPEARASLRRKLLALNPDLPQVWVG